MRRRYFLRSDASKRKTRDARGMSVANKFRSSLRNIFINRKVCHELGVTRATPTPFASETLAQASRVAARLSFSSIANANVIINALHIGKKP